MCGIVGYVGLCFSQDIFFVGFVCFEYCGYDFVGVVVIDGDGLFGMWKKVGKFVVLCDFFVDVFFFDGFIGIGYICWVIYGGFIDVNVYLYFVDDDKFVFIYNGIIENFLVLCEELFVDGVVFCSEIDIEVVVVLFGCEYVGNGGDFEFVFCLVVNCFEGVFILFVMYQDYLGFVVGVCCNFLFVIGFGEGENFFGFDVVVFIEYICKVFVIGQDQIVLIIFDVVMVVDFVGMLVQFELFDVFWDVVVVEKGGWLSFMVKEVVEQFEVVVNMICGCIQDGQVVIFELDGFDELFFGINCVIIIVCGIVLYVVLVGKYVIEQWVCVVVDVEFVYEFCYCDLVIGVDIFVVLISQFGEIMDMFMVVKYVRECGVCIFLICNIQGVIILCELDVVVYMYVGFEVVVVLMKVFLVQIIVLLLFGFYMGCVCGVVVDVLVDVVEFVVFLEKIVLVFEGEQEYVMQFVGWMVDIWFVLFFGCYVGYLIVFEGVFKFKEIFYIYVEGFVVGEFKYGLIVLIELGQLVFVLVLLLCYFVLVYFKVVLNIQEICVCGVCVIVIVEVGDVVVLLFVDEVIYILFVGVMFELLFVVVLLQIFVMVFVMVKGFDVDQLCNFVKFVMVE